MADIIIYELSRTRGVRKKNVQKYEYDGLLVLYGITVQDFVVKFRLHNSRFYLTLGRSVTVQDFVVKFSLDYIEEICYLMYFEDTVRVHRMQVLLGCTCTFIHSNLPNAVLSRSEASSSHQVHRSTHLDCESGVIVN